MRIVTAAFWNLFCQGVLSACSFLLNLLLVRVLLPTQFGHFALLVGIFYLLSCVSQSLISYPATLRLGRAPEELPTVFGEALSATLPLSLALAAGIGIFAALQAGSAVALAASASFVGLQLQGTSRRALIAAGRFYLCVFCDGIAYVAGVTAIAATAYWHGIDLVTVFTIQSIAYVASVIASAWFSGARFPARLSRSLSFIRTHWRLSAPTLSCSVIDALAAQLGLYAVAFLCGSAETAVFAAAVVPTSVLNPLGLAMVNTMLPRVSAASRISFEEAKRTAVRVAALYGAPYLAVVAVIATWSGPALQAMSGHGHAAHYAGAGAVVRWLCIANACLFFFTCVQSFLLAIGRSKLALAMQLGRLLGMAGFSLLLVRGNGAIGAAQAATLAACAGLLTWRSAATLAFRRLAARRA
jgi:O-antigen/teichoic acid export membrane protein